MPITYCCTRGDSPAAVIIDSLASARKVSWCRCSAAANSWK